MQRGETKIQQGRRCYAAREWEDAYEAFIHADESGPLGCEDLELLAWCAALTGRDDQMLATLERVYRLQIEGGRELDAGLAAFWIGFRLVSMGEMGRAGGWFARAQRAVDCDGGDCALRGWLLLPVIHGHLAAGNHDAAHDAAAEAVAIGERFGARDLAAFARNLQGRALMRRGEVAAGLALVDEVLVSVSAGEIGPLVAGLVYCSVIASCQQVYALDRAREWTEALAGWCDAQPQLVTFTHTCFVHRAEILQLRGAWPEALAEAQRVFERLTEVADPEALGGACYEQAEIYRLRGELIAAEEAYRKASRYGGEPQPGMALLRLAQGRSDAAVAALNRVLAATTAPLPRARFLPARVEVALAARDLEGARGAARELSEIAGRFGTEVLEAMAAHARGAVLLAEDDTTGAIDPLRLAFRVWQRIGAPYQAARTRALLGRAFGALGDRDGEALELESARQVFEELGAALDLADLDRYLQERVERPRGLTPRELEVLRLLAGGRTNKAIARALHVSERTIDRHVSNIFTKLDVSSRSAATAFAYEHGLV